MIPPIGKYVLWAAVNNESPYKIEEDKINLLFDDDCSLFPKGQRLTLPKACADSDELCLLNKIEKYSVRYVQSHKISQMNLHLKTIQEIQVSKRDWSIRRTTTERIIYRNEY